MTTFDESCESWGRYPKARHLVRRLRWKDEPLPLGPADPPVLPFGLGRSYGDSCLNDGGVLLTTRDLNRLIDFNPGTGVLRAEAGASLEEVLSFAVPRGFFLPVTPGTKFVTLGGAIANDVHGKNHHRVGTFGRFVTRFELLRSDGSRLVCSPTENPELFAATIGGLGLTGLITWVELTLRRIDNPWIDGETIRFDDLDAFFQLSEESEARFEYTVAWVDCIARGRELGRGIFIRGNHAPADVPLPRPHRGLKLTVPFTFPELALNPLTMKAMNTAYFHLHPRGRRSEVVHYEPFFYPLDGVLEWNRAYGARGLLQYQCVVPTGDGSRAIRSVLERIAAAGSASFLAVLKTFGDVPSPGLMSFPRPGVTLALDFPNNGASTFALLDELDVLVRECGGALYPAKDARMSPANFRTFFPQWQAFSRHVDPRFRSDFWKRVTAGQE